MRTVPKAKQPETEIPSQPAVYTVHDRKFIVDTVYKDEPAETLKTYKKGHCKGLIPDDFDGQMCYHILINTACLTAGKEDL